MVYVNVKHHVYFVAFLARVGRKKISSLLHYPRKIKFIHSFSLCTPLPDSFVLLQTNGCFASSMLKLRLTFGNALSLICSPKQWSYLPSGRDVTAHASILSAAVVCVCVCVCLSVCVSVCVCVRACHFSSIFQCL